jgi:hypothetical protein
MLEFPSGTINHIIRLAMDKNNRDFIIFSQEEDSRADEVKGYLDWEPIEDRHSYRSLERLRIHGGWLVRSTLQRYTWGAKREVNRTGAIGLGFGGWGIGGVGLAFVPDPKHEWQIGE